MANPIRILLAEDQAIIRQGLRYILEAQPDMRVVSEAEDGQAAIQAALGVKPDLILMDIRMPGRDGIEATRAILYALPETKIVLLTTFDIQEYLERYPYTRSAGRNSGCHAGGGHLSQRGFRPGPGTGRAGWGGNRRAG